MGVSNVRLGTAGLGFRDAMLSDRVQVRCSIFLLRYCNTSLFCNCWLCCKWWNSNEVKKEEAWPTGLIESRIMCSSVLIQVGESEGEGETLARRYNMP
jgi:hypothetical protein